MEIPIETVYLENNSSSHFHPLRDSWRIYGKIVKFCASAFISFLIDYGAVALFYNLLNIPIIISNPLARVLSSYVNYSVNRHVVFKGGNKDSILRYYLLVVIVMILSTGGLELLTRLGIHNLIAKPLIDIPLFVLNYYVQRKYVFKPKPEMSLG